MTEYAGAVFLVVGFIVIFKILKLVDRSTRVVKITRQAIADFRNKELGDDAIEAAMQCHAKQLFGLFFLITVGGGLAVCLPVGVIWGLDRLQLVSLDATLRITLSWPFLLATTALILIALAFKRTR